MMRKTNQNQKMNFLEGKYSNIYVEKKYDLADVRALRNKFLEIAYTLTEKSKCQSILILLDPKVTEPRIMEEWDKVNNSLLPEITKRLNIVIYHSGKFSYSIKVLDKEIRDVLEKHISKQSVKSGTRLQSANLYYEILKILVYRWMNDKGPISSTELSDLAGCSYPTIAEARKRLHKSIETLSDRTFKLRHFPVDEWRKLLVESDQVRSTMWFADKSGLKPRDPESLLKRYKKIMIDDTAIGGVFGAVKYFRDLDITGSPRLDLTIHSSGKMADLNFIGFLDPALEKVDKSNNAINLVVHFIRRKVPLFLKESSNINWADPVECLLDLHEARLESQAKEFLEYYYKKTE
jgi:hypothetical protein